MTMEAMRVEIMSVTAWGMEYRGTRSVPSTCPSITRSSRVYSRFTLEMTSMLQMGRMCFLISRCRKHRGIRRLI